MLTYVTGDLFESPAQTLVNTVNTVGVMGKGIALRFKQIYPEMFQQYQKLCENGQLEVGELFLWRTPNKWVLNFPTKRHWRRPSKLQYLEAGLEKFVDGYSDSGIHSIAFPPLGCGNGELDFNEVRPLMERYLADLPIQVYIYPPLSHGEVPEHRQQDEIKRWLRSEPINLPFGEVWADLNDLLAVGTELRTVGKGAAFVAELVEAGEQHEGGVHFRAAGRSVFVAKEQLAQLWRDLRHHGMVNAKALSPNVAVYVVPLLATLPYIRLVNVANTYKRLGESGALGIQFVPRRLASSSRGQAAFALNAAPPPAAIR